MTVLQVFEEDQYSVMYYLVTLLLVEQARQYKVY